MLQLFGGKSKFEAGVAVQVQHPVTNAWIEGVILRDEGDSYYTIQEENGEVFNHIHLKKLKKSNKKKQTAPDRLVSETSSISSQSSTRSTSSFNFFGASSSKPKRNDTISNETGSLTALPEIALPVEPAPFASVSSVEAPPPMAHRKSSIKILVEPPQEIFEKKIQRRTLEESEKLYLDRQRKCNRSEGRVLDLSDLQLEDIPSMFLQFSFSVQDLSLRKNQFVSCDSIAQFHRLQVLDLSFNSFRESHLGAFRTLASLEMLTQLSLAGNELSELPMEICSLRRLEKLDLRRNLLHTLPQELTNCVSLLSINLSRNSFQRVPDCLNQLKALSDLNLENNPCLDNGAFLDAGERVVFLLEKRAMFKNPGYRRAVVANATSVLQRVARKESQQLIPDEVD